MASPKITAELRPGVYKRLSLCVDKIFAVNILSAVILARPFISSSNKRRKPARCRSASLGDEPVTIVVTTVRSWSERPSTSTFPEVPEIVSPSTPTSLGLLGRRAGESRPKRKRKSNSWRPAKGHTGTSGEAQADRRLIAPQTNSIVTTIVTGSSPRLANRYLGGFLQLFPKLRLLLGKVNDGTSSKYKRLPSALTKCLLQVRA